MRLVLQAQLLAEEENDDDAGGNLRGTEVHNEGDNPSQVNDSGDVSRATTLGMVKPLRKILMDIFVDNAHLHKLVNSLTLKALLADSKPEKAQGKEVTPRKSMLFGFSHRI